MIFWISSQNWVWSYGFQSFSSTFIFSINCRTHLQRKVKNRISLWFDSNKWKLIFQLWNDHKTRFRKQGDHKNWIYVRFNFDATLKGVREFIEKMNVEENDWKPYDHTQFWMLIQNIMFFRQSNKKICWRFDYHILIQDPIPLCLGYSWVVNVFSLMFYTIL